MFRPRGGREGRFGQANMLLLTEGGDAWETGLGSNLCVFILIFNFRFRLFPAYLHQPRVTCQRGTRRLQTMR